MERAYEKQITLGEEFRMKYETVKNLEHFGYTLKRDKEDILVFAGDDRVGRFTYSSEEDAPVALIEKSNLTKNFSLADDLLQRKRRKVFKEISLRLGWAVSDNNKILS